MLGAELTRDQPAFFALIWNNEVSNKVIHRGLSVRPGCWRQTGQAGNWKEAWRLALQPAAIWMRWAPTLRAKALQEPLTGGCAYQRGLAPPARRPHKACIYLKTLPCVTNAEAAGGSHKNTPYTAAYPILKMSPQFSGGRAEHARNYDHPGLLKYFFNTFLLTIIATI